MNFPRTFLYSKEEPKGRIFTDLEEFQQALKDGWVEAPYLVGKENPEKEAVCPKPIGNIFTLSEPSKEVKSVPESEPVFPRPVGRPPGKLGPKKG